MPSDKRNLARHLRNNMTLPEVLLWNKLKQDQIGFHIRRQYQFDQFILDFYCAAPRVAIEIDGEVHELKRKSDDERDLALAAKGVTVFRVSAKSVLANPSFVAEAIQEFLTNLRATPQQDASPHREAGEQGTK
ncbi:MAG: DUF559 domain-containing protein [Armatimonadetes bacterium]|nr:DUF559 domain-containing protein [Armatimonadota bacterium]